MKLKTNVGIVRTFSMIIPKNAKLDSSAKYCAIQLANRARRNNEVKVYTLACTNINPKFK